MNFIAVDIGNTRTKFAVQNGHETVFFGSIEDVIENLRNNENSVHWAVARTGSQTQYQQLEQNIKRHRPLDTIEELSFQKIRQRLPLSVAADVPEQTGIDRLLAAAAAVRYSADWNSTPKLILDAGSAVTIDLVSPQDCFEGGAILPGLKAAAASLTEISPNLPLIAYVAGASFPGRNTAAAIQTGLYLQVIGAASLCSRKAASEFGTAVPLFLTGGDAAVLYDGLRDALPETPLILAPDLVFRGIFLTSAFAG